MHAFFAAYKFMRTGVVCESSGSGSHRLKKVRETALTAAQAWMQAYVDHARSRPRFIPTAARWPYVAEPQSL